MKKQILWVVVSGLMVLSLVLIACGPAPVEEEKGKETAPVVTEEKAKEEKAVVEKEAMEKEVVSPEKPKYGGTLSLSLSGDFTNFDYLFSPIGDARQRALFNQELWAGDWAKGPAGGYGTSVTDWGDNYDIWDHKAGYHAESWKWTIDEEKDEGTIVYQIRQGVHYALNPDSEASRLVGGREVTADDVIYSLKRTITTPAAFIYRANPELRVAEITKTGPWEVTVKVPLAALTTAISRFGDNAGIYPPEAVEKYGDMNDWRNSVSAGPFMLTDYVAGSAAILVRNPNYWMKDPIGPGKGNQLPYLERVRYLVIPDSSTRLAALRTAKLDQMTGVSLEDAALMRQTTPALLETHKEGAGGWYIAMRTDKTPFNDVRVRRALMMATDFQAISQGLFGGVGHIVEFPFGYSTAYAGLYLSLDDPEMPESVRELYVYNPEKAKQLLAEAGYPDGFKTSLLLTTSQVDYYSIVKDMWAKVGIDLKLDVREIGVLSSIRRKKTHEALIANPRGPVSSFYLLFLLTAKGPNNASMIDDPVINEAAVEIRRAMVKEGVAEAMRITKEMVKYVLDQAYGIPTPSTFIYTYWWPWLKNYSGENEVGYADNIWPQYIWIDQDLKKQMGY